MTEPTSGLSGVLKRGAAMSAAGLVIAQTATVVQTIVLARLLGPYEVGLFMAGSVLIGFLVTASQGALVQGLIHRETDIEVAANTALIATFAAGVVGTLLVLAAAPLIGVLFHSSQVGVIAAATSGLMVLHVLASVPDALMQRAFQFKRQLVIMPAVSIVFAAVSIVFAARGYGAWAMVIGWYASTMTSVVLSWWMAKWRPFGARFSLRIWREMARYSFPMLLDSLADRSREVFEQVIVGRVLGTADLGQYRYAYRIASLPSLAIITIGSHVLFPAYSRISNDNSRFRQAFLRALDWIWFAAAPMGALLIAVGPAVVVLLLGEEWRYAGMATAAMAGIGLGTALNAVTWEAIKGAGRSSLLNWSPVLSIGIGLPLILALLPFGLVGVGIAISIAYLVVGIVGLELAHGVVGVSRRDLWASLWPTTVAAIVGLAVVLPLERLVVRSDQYSVWPGLVWIVAEAALFAIIYVASLMLMSAKWSRALRDIVRRAAAKLKRA
ncbi:oligosaccharide flippase family protein [Mycobacterium neglectum]|uniref:oligosaccharide flippase family protein n=1 Tax=Mycobacterium neglectum TaxID=242737 RepID=UPI000BFF13AB|nr:oligosaccharide flippase family protein [Mycobacterium neglectum]